MLGRSNWCIRDLQQVVSVFRKTVDGLVVLLNGTEHLMTDKEHSRGLQKVPVQRFQCVCKRCRTFEESEIVGADKHTKEN